MTWRAQSISPYRTSVRVRTCGQAEKRQGAVVRVVSVVRRRRRRRRRCRLLCSRLSLLRARLVRISSAWFL